jgi:hypothetical protein
LYTPGWVAGMPMNNLVEMERLTERQIELYEQMDAIDAADDDTDEKTG